MPYSFHFLVLFRSMGESLCLNDMLKSSSLEIMCEIMLINSVAKGPKFRPQNTKGAEKNGVGPNICLICQKRAGKGPNFF
jgi:hypothetical protein